MAALVTAAAAVLAARRARAGAEQRLRAGLDQVTGALGSGGELAASLDVDDVVRRTLDAAAALPGVDAVVLDALQRSGEPLRVMRGVSEEDAERAKLQTPPN